MEPKKSYNWKDITVRINGKPINLGKITAIQYPGKIIHPDVTLYVKLNLQLSRSKN